MTKTQQCSECGVTTTEWFVCPTPFQESDPDTWSMTPEALVADGASVLCLSCTNAYEADVAER